MFSRYVFLTIAKVFFMLLSISAISITFGQDQLSYDLNRDPFLYNACMPNHHIVHQNVFDETPLKPNQRRKPMLIGCSGGGGHNAAIAGIANYLTQHDVFLKKYEPVLAENRPFSPQQATIKNGLRLMEVPAVGRLVKTVVEYSPFPVLPDSQAIDQEVAALSKKEKSLKKRNYIDMLLDVYPAGYESAAIWNTLQRADKVQDLKKLVQLQSHSDQDNYQAVYEYYTQALQKAAQDGVPYTEIISTQAMALPALCDAVKNYNEWLFKEGRKTQAPQICIHQYLTDLATPGSVHFFDPISRLSYDQQRQMKLYGVSLEADLLDLYFPSGSLFQGCYSIPPKQNPMIRDGFKNSRYDNSQKFHQTITIELKQEPAITIASDEKIGSIMLGSQAGNDTFEYIEHLLSAGMHKVFVFGGKTNPILKQKIEDYLQKHPLYKSRVIPLGNQDDPHIAAVMSRSDMVVIRGGGLSVMEQMGMNHASHQSVFIHHADSDSEVLSSGISWEDYNVDKLISFLEKDGTYSKKTSPSLAKRDFQKAQVIVLLTQIDPSKKDLIRLSIENLSDSDFDKIAPDILRENSKSESIRKTILYEIEHKEKTTRKRLEKIQQWIIPIKKHTEQKIIEQMQLEYRLKQSTDNPNINQMLLEWSSKRKKISQKLYEKIVYYRAIECVQQELLSAQTSDNTIKNSEAIKSAINQKRIEMLSMSIKNSKNLFSQILHSLEKILLTVLQKEKKITIPNEFLEKASSLSSSQLADKKFAPKKEGVRKTIK